MRIISLKFSVSCLALFACGAANAELSKEEFRNPPTAAKPSALWTWLNGYTDQKQITHELEEMKDKGMGGAIIWDLGALNDPQKMIPAGPQFLGDESLETIHHAMDEAERLGLDLGIVAASSWNSGGTWITPENGSKVLIWSETEVEGPSEFSGVLPLPEKISEHYEDVALLAMPAKSDGVGEAIRLDDKLDADGKLNWSVPPGAWSILRFVSNNTGEFLNCPSPNSKGLVIDHLSREATDAHIHHMLDRLSEGRDGFGALKRVMLDSYEVAPGTDWTPEFVESFKARNGYDPVPWLPALAGRMVGGEEKAERFLHDYHKTVSDLMIEDHYGRVRELVNERGLKLLAEAGHGGYARVDPLKALGASDVPMGEFWNHRKNWVTKEAASAANLYGKKFVNSESFTGWRNWQDGPAAYKRLFDIALCAGLNQVTFHTFAHNPPEAGLPGFGYHAGEHFNVNSTWWPYAGPMLDVMSRSCHLLQQGKFVADVLAYYGDNAPNLVPARRIAPTVEPRWEADHCLHCGRLQPVDLSSLGHGYDYDYLNEEVLLERIEFRDGKLILPDGMSYRLLVLPDREAISPEALKKIGELVKAGATVVGRKPERSNSLRNFPQCDVEVRELADEIWGPCDGEKVTSHDFGNGKVFWNVPLDEVLAEMEIAEDFVVENLANEAREIDYIHRATEDEEIYFVSNTSTDDRMAICRFRMGSGWVPTFWHPEDGSISECHVYETGEGFVRIPLDLPAFSSVFVIFKKAAHADHIVNLQDLAGEMGEGLEVLEMDSNSIKASIGRAGTYAFVTASDRKGEITLESVPADLAIDGPWQVTFSDKLGGPGEITMDGLSDWTKSEIPGVKYFSGTAIYRKNFELATMPADGNVQLDLGAVLEVASIKVNGKEAGVFWKPPYRIEIGNLLQSGTNHLEISVANVWNNRIVGDLARPSEPRITKTNLTEKFSAKDPLVPSGILGPVRLQFPVTTTIELK